MPLPIRRSINHLWRSAWDRIKKLFLNDTWKSWQNMSRNWNLRANFCRHLIFFVKIWQREMSENTKELVIYILKVSNHTRSVYHIHFVRMLVFCDLSRLCSNKTFKRIWFDGNTNMGTNEFVKFSSFSTFYTVWRFAKFWIRIQVDEIVAEMLFNYGKVLLLELTARAHTKITNTRQHG